MAAGRGGILLFDEYPLLFKISLLLLLCIDKAPTSTPVLKKTHTK